MKPTLNKYISRKLDGVEGQIPQLVHMFKKAFSAPNFRSFWNIWNPIYSYVLTYYIYKPLRKIIPRVLAVVATFIVNGLFHDLMVFIFLKRTDFVVTKLFLIYGVVVMIETFLVINITNKKIPRVIYNLSLLLLPVVVVLS